MDRGGTSTRRSAVKIGAGQKIISSKSEPRAPLIGLWAAHGWPPKSTSHRDHICATSVSECTTVARRRCTKHDQSRLGLMRRRRRLRFICVLRRDPAEDLEAHGAGRNLHPHAHLGRRAERDWDPAALGHAAWGCAPPVMRQSLLCRYAPPSGCKRLVRALGPQVAQRPMRGPAEGAAAELSAMAVAATLAEPRC